MDPLAQPQQTLPPATADPACVPIEAASSRPRRSWVPVRSLTTRHRPRILAHLLALDEHDRYLRFGFAASDAQIAHYADAIDLERDEVFGIFNRRLELIAMAHLAYAPAPQFSGKPAMAEFGVSVSRDARGRGLAARLFDHAVLHARNRGIATLFIQALSENTAMLKIARNAGATVERAGSESEAWLALPPDDIASQVGELVEGHAAELDYQFKSQAQRVHRVIEAFSEARTNISSALRATADN